MIDFILSNIILTHAVIAALVILALVYTTWIISLIVDDASIIDMIWALGFGLVAAVLITLVAYKTPFRILVAALPILWAIRYTTFIFSRNLGKGEDDRYTHLRQKIKKKGIPWPLFSFFMVYGFQALAMFIVSLPVIVGISAPETQTIGVLAVLGAALWTVGFFFEAIGDWQLTQFKKKHKDFDGPYEEKPVMNEGLWRYTRHPNYFGNACMWWGIAIVALSAPWGWIGLIGAAFMNYALVFLTGKANNEAKMKKRPAYREYIKNTSGFIPMPPKGRNENAKAGA